MVRVIKFGFMYGWLILCGDVMNKKHLIAGVVIGLLLMGAILVLKHKEDDCTCEEEGWECCCCGY